MDLQNAAQEHSRTVAFISIMFWWSQYSQRDPVAGFKKMAAPHVERLPFYCCALSFTNFEDAVATADGTVFDVSNIVPYVNKFKTNPVTGEALDLGDLIPLKFHQNANDQFECPILKKVFNQVCRQYTFLQLGICR